MKCAGGGNRVVERLNDTVPERSTSVVLNRAVEILESALNNHRSTYCRKRMDCDLVDIDLDIPDQHSYQSKAKLYYEQVIIASVWKFEPHLLKYAKYRECDVEDELQPYYDTKEQKAVVWNVTKGNFVQCPCHSIKDARTHERCKLYFQIVKEKHKDIIDIVKKKNFDLLKQFYRLNILLPLTNVR